MKLRDLKEKDAELMLSWMHDDFVVHDLRTDFSKKTLEDCQNFIQHGSDAGNYHQAIVDDKDTYMGTVSLKNIDTQHSCAEFAITVRKEAMGRGYSSFAMEGIIDYAFRVLELDTLYWYVSGDNHRANRFYEKNGYRPVPQVPDHFKEGFEHREEAGQYVWYCLKKGQQGILSDEG